VDGGRLVVDPDEGEVLVRGGFGVVAKVGGAPTGGSFAVVEHPLAPGVLAAPPHTHANEDELSFVIEGRMGALIGEDVIEAAAGAYVFKPRGVPHTFWNPGPTPARVLEIIAPAGFETYFRELGQILAVPGPPDIPRMMGLAARYGLTLHMERLPEVMERFGVALEGPTAPAE
jgi:mannose-6-phosphate isomerase-like protein (cupin superfamily)